MGVARPDVFVCYLTVFVDDEYGCGCEAVVEQVEDVVGLGYIVVLGRVEDGEFDADSLGNVVGAREIVGTDCEYLSTSLFDFFVVSLQLT